MKSYDLLSEIIGQILGIKEADMHRFKMIQSEATAPTEHARDTSTLKRNL